MMNPANPLIRKSVQLLAPVGSFESLQAAINAGADAVYFGVEQLNMRAKSINSFAVDDLPEIRRICSTNDLKTCITLNTVMYDHDLRLLENILREVKRHHIDAVIASDFAVIQLCRQMSIPLHVSTQSNVSNIEAVEFFAPFSDLVVLARELTLKQIATITREIERRKLKGISGRPLQIEVFVHGALCMAVSGKCYLSLHAHNASANRGACTQNCRRPYRVTDLETNNELIIDNEFIMSPKDLCTIDILDQVVATGVDVLKIEGRGKSADYVFTVTKCYREALQAIEEGSYTPEKIAAWQEQLSTVYNRGFWEGYYLGRKFGEWTTQPGSAATEKKIYLGKSTKYYPRIGVAEFHIETGVLKRGDTIMIIGPRIGMVKEQLTDMKINGGEGTEATKGDKVTFPFAQKLTSADKLYKVTDARHA